MYHRVLGSVKTAQAALLLAVGGMITSSMHLARLTLVAHRYWKFGGGTKPPNSRSISAANLIVV
jgi:hypothetical protein